MVQSSVSGMSVSYTHLDVYKRQGLADTINVGETHLNALLAGQVNAGNTCHSSCLLYTSYAFFHTFNYTSWLYVVIYLLLILAFNYFYVAIQYLSLIHISEKDPRRHRRVRQDG